MQIEMTETPVPVEFEVFYTGPSGGRFILYPEKQRHTEEDVKLAKSWLHRQRDVVSLQIRWKQEGDNAPGPLKIPDQAIIKNLQKELGEEKSYIEELELKIENEHILTKEERKEFKKNALYKQQQETITSLNKTIKGLRKDKEDLIIKLVNCEKNK